MTDSLKHPEAYYYDEDSTDIAYTRIPTGRLDASHLLKGSPDFWIKEDKKQQKKKTLVLTDWTAEQWSPEKCRDQIRHYSNLIEEGFELYVYQDPREIVKLTKDNLDLLKAAYFRSRIKPIKKTDIISLMVTQGIRVAAKQILCVPLESIQLSQVLASKHKQEDLIRYIMSEHQGKINVDVAHPVFLLKKAILSSQFSELKFTDNYVTLDIDMSNRFRVNQDEIDDCHIDAQMIMQGFFSNIKQCFEKIENLNVSLMSSKAFNYELGTQWSQIHQLKSLYVPQVSDSDFKALGLFDEAGLSEAALSTLESLSLRIEGTLENSFGSKNNFLKLLNVIKKLKFLNLSGSEILSGVTLEEDDLTELSLPELEFLNLSYTSISGKSLLSILKNATQLKTLNLRSCSFLDTPESQLDLEMLPENTLKNLEVLRMGSGLTLANLAGFLKKAKKIKELTLYKVSFFEKLLLDNEVLDALARLDDLTFEGGDIDAEGLVSILTRNKNLRSLGLVECCNIKGIELAKLPMGSSSKLHHLMIGDSNIEHILDLAISAHDLRSLALNDNGANNLFSNASLPPNSFSKLETFSLNRSEISQKEMSLIMNNAVNLKSLSVHYCQNIVSLFSSLSHGESQLEHLSLGDANLSVIELELLLKNSKNLKSLDLMGWHQFAGFDFNQLPDGALDQLEFLNIGGHGRHINEELILKFASTRLPNLHAESRKKLEELCLGLRREREGDQRNANSLSYGQTGGIDEPTPVSSINSQIGEPNGGASFKNRGFESDSVDCDTNTRTKEFNVTEIFWGLNGVANPHPSHYRLNITNDLKITDDSNAPFQLTKKDDLELTEHLPIPYQWVEQDTFELPHLPAQERAYYSKINLNLTSNWAPLPSLSIHEHITHLHVEGINKADVEIQYSKRDNLYYIRNKNSQTDSRPLPIKIDYILTTPPHLDRSGSNCSSSIREIVNKYQNYTEGALKLLPNATGLERLRALQEQNVGACRHRAIAFKEEVERLHRGTQVRVIGNDCHMFAEVQEPSGEWICCDLGGYAGAKLNFDSHNAPTSELKKPKVIKFDANDSLIDIENSVFNTWKINVGHEKTLPEYMLHILNGQYSDKKTLVQFKSPEIINDFQLMLQKTAQNTNRPVFYVDSPDDLRCSAPWIKRDPKTNEGKLQKPPGGPLFEFLQAHKNSQPPAVLIINWDKFKAQEIVQFNSLLDAHRVVDGVEVPESVHIVGLYTPTRPGAYKGVDFLSRFSKKTTCQFTADEFKKAATPFTNIVEVSEDFKSVPIVIDVYESSDWKTLLLGQWTFKGGQLQFKDGSLETALKDAKGNNRPIEIKNGLWENERFTQFWEQAKLQGKIGPDIKIQTNTGYDWHELLSEVKFTNAEISEHTYILNPSTLGQAFEDYKIDSHSSELETLSGWLEKNEGQTVEVYLTQDLEAHQWARFLASAKAHQVGLSLHVAPGLKLPAGFPTVPIQKPVASEKMQVYVSPDIDYTVYELSETHKGAKVIDISECDASDLLVSVNAQLDESMPEHPRYRFLQKINALLVALRAGETLVLKGDFKPDLIEALASFCLPEPYAWVNGQKETYPGKCILVTSLKAEKEFNFTQCITPSVPIPYLKKSFIQTQTDEQYLKTHPGGDPQDDFKGLTHIEHFSAPMDSETKVSLSFDLSQAFEAERLKTVTDVLKDKPFIFIAGKTGVGKSTFIKKVIKKDKAHYSVSFGAEGCEAWASNTDKTKMKVLFIDEANIDAGDFSMFEGLYNTPPGILVNERYYPLDEHHKVIFAGNPLSYGNRSLPSFFARHGNARIFNPLTTDYLYHKVLKPVLKELPISNQEAISIDILKVYQYICALPGDRVLISPRELQMMAVLVASNPNKQAHYIYSIGQNCVPKAYQAAFKSWYKNTIGEPDLKLESQVLPPLMHPDTQFVLTPSRMTAYQKTMDCLRLRTFKQTTPNKKARYAGLGGLIIEGEPGIGKSQFVTDILIDNGFRKGNLANAEFQTGAIFYDMKASLSTTEKKALLIKAFHEGTVVIMDEMNSAPSMEKLLNDLLMGYGPQGERPKVPGFMIIATQNPISMEGRSAESVAIERRLMKLHLSQYSESEMQTILMNKELEKDPALLLVREYLAVREYGLKKGKEPLPTFRQLLDMANYHIAAKAAHQAHPLVGNLVQEAPVILHNHIPLSEEIKGSPPPEAILNIHLPLAKTKDADSVASQEPLDETLKKDGNRSRPKL